MLNDTTDPVLETAMVFARLCRPGDEVAPEMANSKYRTALKRALSRRGLALENPAGDVSWDRDWYVAATIAWGGK